MADPAPAHSPVPPAPDDEAARLTWRSLPAVRYPDLYLWFVFVSAMDVMLTWAILARGGTEVNPIARAVIREWGLPGATLFKFGLVVLVIVMCEVIGRRADRTAQALIRTGIVISSLPVIYSFMLLAVHVWK